MRIKTMFIVLVTVLLTTFLVQNTGSVIFSFLWADFRVSKLLMLAIVTLIAFVLGVLVGRPAKVKRLGGDYDEETSDPKKTNTLSDEDKDYIS